MLKTLLKKQLFELNRSFFQNRKTGKARSKAMAITSIVLFAAAMVLIIGGIFLYLAFQLKPLIEAGVGWLYFLISFRRTRCVRQRVQHLCEPV